MAGLFGNILGGISGGLQNVATGGQFVQSREQARREAARRAQEQELLQQRGAALGQALGMPEGAGGGLFTPQDFLNVANVQQQRQQFGLQQQQFAAQQQRAAQEQERQNRLLQLKEQQIAQLGQKAQREAMQKALEDRMEFVKGLPRVQSAYEATIDKFSEQKDLLKDLEQRAGKGTVGFLGTRLAGVEGTEAADFAADLSTVQAQEAFGALQALREASKTGGALGSVSEKELKLLENARVALEQSQSPSAFKKNLNKLTGLIDKSQKRVEKAYRQELELYGIEPEQQEQQAPQRLRYNPATGVFE